mmetsp:Transcript_145216/g.368480  ORF Transcript_145216/g.368480 Transcript_145216/m.368480 type:complete len:303 (+) Transcript_145216:5294-6202(+)
MACCGARLLENNLVTLLALLLIAACEHDGRLPIVLHLRPRVDMLQHTTSLAVALPRALCLLAGHVHCVGAKMLTLGAAPCIRAAPPCVGEAPVVVLEATPLRQAVVVKQIRLARRPQNFAQHPRHARARLDDHGDYRVVHMLQAVLDPESKKLAVVVQPQAVYDAALQRQFPLRRLVDEHGPHLRAREGRYEADVAVDRSAHEASVDDAGVAEPTLQVLVVSVDLRTVPELWLHHQHGSEPRVRLQVALEGQRVRPRDRLLGGPIELGVLVPALQVDPRDEVLPQVDCHGGMVALRDHTILD